MSLSPNAAPLRPAPSPVKAALWMLGSIASFSLMAVAGRELGGRFSTFEIMFWRSLLGLVIVTILLSLRRGRWARLRTDRLGLHLTRNLAHFFGQNCWFYAVALIPLAQVFALEFTSPIWVALLAPLFLAERFTAARALAAGLGFLGALLVTGVLQQGDFSEISHGQWIAAVAAIGFAVTIMTTKRLSDTETVLAILFYMCVSQALMALAMEALVQERLPRLPLGADGRWIVLVGLCGMTAHFCMTNAFRFADAAVVAPMDFFRLPLIAVVGAVLYAESLEASVLIGGVVVFAGNFINILAERRRVAATAAR